MARSRMSGWTIPLLLSLAVAVNLWVILSPSHGVYGLIRWGIFDPFRGAGVASLLGLTGVGLLGLATVLVVTRRVAEWGRRPLPFLVLLVIAGTAIKGGLALSLGDGLDRYRFKVVESSHGEFPIEAALVEDLSETLRSYEAYVRETPTSEGRLYLSAKGPGIIASYVLLHRAANSSVGQALLSGWADDEAFGRKLESSLARRPPGTTPELTPVQERELARSVTLIALLFPFLTYLTLVPLFVIGRSVAGPSTAVLACLAYLFVPGTTIIVGHVDFGLFPFLFCSIVAAFWVGYRKQSPWLLGLAATCFAVYLTYTLAAVVALAFVTAAVGLDLVSDQRAGRLDRERVLAVARTVLTFAGWIVGLLVLGYLTFRFDPITRYAYARELQANWVVRGHPVFWWVVNVMEFAISFSFGYLALTAAQCFSSTRALLEGEPDDLSVFVIAWMIVALALEFGGMQHGETNRLWAFMYAPACLAVAAMVAKHFGRRIWMPFLAFLLVLLVSRYGLSYI